MRTEIQPYNYPLNQRFPVQRKLFDFEGGYVLLVEQDALFYVILDESTMASFLLLPGKDDEILNQLINIGVFETEAESDEFLQVQGWAKPGQA
ncbi:MAG: hypothetical protein WCK35_04470 [Chloroflexota bacterium]